MENKQTAVDWLKKKCQDSLDREPEDANEKEIGYSMALKHIITLIDLEAKQMEKEQMFEFAEQVLKNTECSFTGLPFMTTGYDNIYEETYGK